MGAGGSSDCMDIAVSMPKSLCYEWVTPDESYKTCFTIFCRKCDNVRYSEMCYRCANCFGCVGLRDKEYCIFNKQYAKEEYEILVSEIIRHIVISKERGEFFPAKYSLFAYNMSDAMIRYPKNKDMVLWTWENRDDTEIKINIPDGAMRLWVDETEINPNMVDDDICNTVLVCELSGKPYRIMKQELEIYRRLSYPLPRYHHDMRNKLRLERRASRDFTILNWNIGNYPL